VFAAGMDFRGSEVTMCALIEEGRHFVGTMLLV
jgi:hypothetical protein